MIKICKNCNNEFETERNGKKYCSNNCIKRNWDKKHKDYYKNYYLTHKEKELGYYRERKSKYKKLHHNYYQDKREVILLTK